LLSHPEATNVASLVKVIPGWGKSDDFIAPWFATLEAQQAKK
jgi:simple sugar transport system substrate-binding protein